MPEQPEKIRAHIYVSGLVQGVYFRQNTKEVASRYSVAGWVRNLPDGRVEAILEGELESVEKVVEWCNSGPPKAKVDNVSIAYEQHTGEFEDFTVSY